MDKGLSPAAEMISEIALGHAKSCMAGMRAGQAAEVRKMRPVVQAYDRALLDPQTKIPTYLHAALEAMRKDMMEYDWNAAADRRDQQERPEHDTDVVGRMMRAGA